MVAKALAKDPSQRFSSVSALARALEQASQIQRLFSVEQPSQDRPSLDQIGQPAQLSLTSPLPLPPEQTEEVTQVTQSGNATLDPPSPIKPVSPLYKQEKPIPLITHHRNPSRSKVALFVGLILLIVGSVSFLHPLAAHIVHPQATSTATAITSVHATVTAISNAHATATAISIRYNTATASGIMFGFDVEHTHSNPYEETLSLSNVSKLVQDWTTSTGDGIGSSPVVTNGVVYVGSRDHKLYAFSAVGCGSPSCRPLWTSPATGNAITSSPAVANGVVYIGSYDHKLYAFHLPGTTP